MKLPSGKSVLTDEFKYGAQDDVIAGTKDAFCNDMLAYKAYVDLDKVDVSKPEYSKLAAKRAVVAKEVKQPCPEEPRAARPSALQKQIEAEIATGGQKGGVQNIPVPIDKLGKPIDKLNLIPSRTIDTQDRRVTGEVYTDACRATVPFLCGKDAPDNMQGYCRKSQADCQMKDF